MTYRKCPECKGAGLQVVDCPYCREAEAFEHDNLTPGECLACHNTGYVEEDCPICHGSGMIIAQAM